ncbi:MAG: hypothetical protein K8F62_17990 [Pseudorhodoplanes sp.]|nr:hypothetical protein [Pseudorhodoplanes sp.]
MTLAAVNCGIRVRFCFRPDHAIGALEHDAEKCEAVSDNIMLNLLESITFMILDRADPKSS